MNNPIDSAGMINTRYMSDQAGQVSDALSGKTSTEGNSSEYTTTAKPDQDQVDTLNLTETAQSLRFIEDSLNDIPVVDQQKVASIREQIDQGNYQIDAARIADRLIDLEEAF